MFKSRSARRQAILYVGLIAVSLLMLAFSASGPVTDLRRGVGFAMAPIQNVLRESGRTVSSLFATLGEITACARRTSASTPRTTSWPRRTDRLRACASKTSS